jgi:hypothetical protein
MEEQGLCTLELLVGELIGDLTRPRGCTVGTQDLGSGGLSVLSEVVSSSVYLSTGRPIG